MERYLSFNIWDKRSPPCGVKSAKIKANNQNTHETKMNYKYHKSFQGICESQLYHIYQNM